jgi:DNA-binding LacI/PurR family transcriptional regulator
MLYRYSMIEEKATIDTIAIACHLSRTTVSAVLRGDAERYRISPATANRVREAAEALDWKPNYFARSLNRKKTGTIGVLFPDVFERFMGETVRGIEEALAEADYRMLLSTSRFDPDEELRAIEAFSYRGVDGLLIAPYVPFAGEPSRSAELAQAIASTPCVVIDRVPDGLDPRAAGFGQVVQADRAAAREATRFLAKDGGRVAFLGFDLAASSVRERCAGYREAAMELGFQAEEVFLRELNPDSTDLVDAVARIDSREDRPPAWLVSTEGLAYKLAAVMEARGRTVGTDVRIARFGMDPPFFDTGLIGLRQPHRELGRTAATLLLKLVDPPPTGDGDDRLHLETIELSVELVPNRNGRRSTP